MAEKAFTGKFIKHFFNQNSIKSFESPVVLRLGIRMWTYDLVPCFSSIFLAKAMYSSLALSCAIPFFVFQASHLALPYKFSCQSSTDIKYMKHLWSKHKRQVSNFDHDYPVTKYKNAV